MTYVLVKPGTVDLCRAKGCGSYLVGVGSEVSDGETAYCASCKRLHTFHVPVDGGDVYVEIERKPRGSRRKAPAPASSDDGSQIWSLVAEFEKQHPLGADGNDRSLLFNAISQLVGETSQAIIQERDLYRLQATLWAPWGSLPEDAQDPNNGRGCGRCFAPIRRGCRYVHKCHPALVELNKWYATACNERQQLLDAVFDRSAQEDGHAVSDAVARIGTLYKVDAEGAHVLVERAEAAQKKAEGHFAEAYASMNHWRQLAEKAGGRILDLEAQRDDLKKQVDAVKRSERSD